MRILLSSLVALGLLAASADANVVQIAIKGPIGAGADVITIHGNAGGDACGVACGGPVLGVINVVCGAGDTPFDAAVVIANTINTNGSGLKASASGNDTGTNAVVTIQGARDGGFCVDVNGTTLSAAGGCCPAVVGNCGTYVCIAAGGGPTNAVPTMSEWGLIVLGLLMAGGAVLMLRRRAPMAA